MAGWAPRQAEAAWTTPGDSAKRAVPLWSASAFRSTTERPASNGPSTRSSARTSTTSRSSSATTHRRTPHRRSAPPTRRATRASSCTATRRTWASWPTSTARSSCPGARTSGGPPTMTGTPPTRCAPRSACSSATPRPSRAGLRCRSSTSRAGPWASGIRRWIWTSPTPGNGSTGSSSCSAGRTCCSGPCGRVPSVAPTSCSATWRPTGYCSQNSACSARSCTRRGPSTSTPRRRPLLAAATHPRSCTHSPTATSSPCARRDSSSSISRSCTARDWGRSTERRWPPA